MSVETSERLAHHIHRHNASDDRILVAQSRAQRRKQILRRHVDLVAQAFGGRFEFGEVVAVGFDQITHALDRIGFEWRAFMRDRPSAPPPWSRRAALRYRPRRAAAARMRDAGTEFGEVAQFLFRQIDLAKQRIGKDLVQLREEAIFIRRREIAEIEVIGLGEAQQQLRGDRPLVALNQIDVARRNAEALCHLGLGQALLLPDPPEARPHEQLLARLARHPRNSRFPSRHSVVDCDKIDKMTFITSRDVTSHHHSNTRHLVVLS